MAIMLKMRMPGMEVDLGPADPNAKNLDALLERVTPQSLPYEAELSTNGVHRATR
jgi:hypothetical protein